MLAKNKGKVCLLLTGITALSIGSVRLMANASRSSQANSGSFISGPESLMAPKERGTCPRPVQQKLRFGCDTSTADNICCFNRHYAEHSGYAFGHQITWLE